MEIDVASLALRLLGFVRSTLVAGVLCRSLTRRRHAGRPLWRVRVWMDFYWHGRKIWIVEGRINPWRSPTLIAPYYCWRALCHSVMSGEWGSPSPCGEPPMMGSMWIVCNYYVPRMSLAKADAFRWLGRTPRKSGWMIFVPTLVRYMNWHHEYPTKRVGPPPYRMKERVHVKVTAVDTCCRTRTATKGEHKRTSVSGTNELPKTDAVYSRTSYTHHIKK